METFISLGGAVHIPIKSPQELGYLVRATRKTQHLLLDDVAGSAGVSHVFVRDVEHGKETIQFGRLLILLRELGIELRADVPIEAQKAFEQLSLTGLKSLKPKASKPPKSVE